MAEPTGKLKFAYETIANMERKIEELNKECESLANDLDNLQKAYSKQHDYYKDIFISLVVVEKENAELKQIKEG